MQVSPYLSFNGNCEEALKFYEQCLGAKIQAIMPFAGTPMAEHMPPDMQNKVMHATFSVDDHVLMGADANPSCYEAPKGFGLALNIAEVEKAERVFADLSNGGTIQMPLQETFWAKRFGMLTDRFGIPWMINGGDLTP